MSFVVSTASSSSPSCSSTATSRKPSRPRTTAPESRAPVSSVPTWGLPPKCPHTTKSEAPGPRSGRGGRSCPGQPSTLNDEEPLNGRVVRQPQRGELDPGQDGGRGLPVEARRAAVRASSSSGLGQTSSALLLVGAVGA